MDVGSNQQTKTTIKTVEEYINILITRKNQGRVLQEITQLKNIQNYIKKILKALKQI